MEVDRNLLVRVTVVHRPTKWSPLDLLHHLASCVKDNKGTARLVRSDIEPVVSRLHRHQQSLLVIEELVDLPQLGEVHMGHLTSNGGVAVDILNGGSTMVRTTQKAFLIIIVELDSKLARLKSTDHLSKGIVGVPLLTTSHDKTFLVVGDKLEVAKLDDTVATVVSQCNPLALLCHRDDVSVHAMSVNPAGFAANSDNVDLIVCVVGDLLVCSPVEKEH